MLTDIVLLSKCRPSDGILTTYFVYAVDSVREKKNGPDKHDTNRGRNPIK